MAAAKKRRCRWYAGRVRAATSGERTAESMGTGIYETACLPYGPTERKHPRGWRYAIGPYSSRARLAKAVRIPGATAIIRGERRAR